MDHQSEISKVSVSHSLVTPIDSEVKTLTEEKMDEAPVEEKAELVPNLEIFDLNGSLGTIERFGVDGVSGGGIQGIGGSEILPNMDAIVKSNMDAYKEEVATDTEPIVDNVEGVIEGKVEIVPNVKVLDLNVEGLANPTSLETNQGFVVGEMREGTQDIEGLESIMAGNQPDGSGVQVSELVLSKDLNGGLESIMDENQQEGSGAQVFEMVISKDLDIGGLESIMDENQEGSGAQISEMVSSKNLELDEKSLDGGDCSVVDPSLAVEVPDRVTGPVVPLRSEHCEAESQDKLVLDSQLLKDQNASIHSVKSMEVDALDESYKQDAHQSMGPHSRISLNESNMGGLVVDLDASFGADGKEAEVKEGFDGDVTEGYIQGSQSGKHRTKTTKPIAGLELPKESEFAPYDLVWGKVKSHPWWPGQIFDPSYASEKAMKHYKKGTFLVAYFGDQTFAWNEPTSLKPFNVNFSEMQKQANTVMFLDAVKCALDEVSRRVEFALSCSCTLEEIHDVLKSQTVNNSGIRENVFRTDESDRFFSVASFEPDKVVNYIKTLTLDQFGDSSRLELVIAQAQLAAFYRWKGYYKLPEFHVSVGLLGQDEHATPISATEGSSHIGKVNLRRQHRSSIKWQDNLEDGSKSNKKEKSLTELMDRKNSSPYFVNGVKDGFDERDGSDDRDANKSGILSGKKRKAIDSSSDVTMTKRRRERLSLSGNSGTESPTSRASRVGERICSIAKQLAGSPPVLKNDGNKFQRSADKASGRTKKQDDIDGSTGSAMRTLDRARKIPKEYSSPDVMLSQLCLAARDPMKGYSFLTIIVGFFTDFRNSINLDRSWSMKHKKSEKKMSNGETRTRDRKPSNSKVRLIESYGHGDVSDSYWTDRIIQSSPEEPSSRRRQKRPAESLFEIPLEDNPITELNTSHDLDSNLKDTSTVEPINSCQHNSSLDSEQKCLYGNDNLAAEQSAEDKDSVELPSTALVLKFRDAKSIPSKSDLNKIFSSFESLKDSETTILRKTSRARVVFQNRNDADTAFKTSCKYSVFGPALVSYKLDDIPATPSKGSRSTKRQKK